MNKREHKIKAFKDCITKIEEGANILIAGGLLTTAQFLTEGIIVPMKEELADLENEYESI